MNAATRGVILAVAAVVLGVLVLGQGFSDSPTLVTTTANGGSSDGTAASDDGDGSADTAADDGATDDGAADDDSSDDGATGDDGEADGGDAPADDSSLAADGGDGQIVDPDDSTTDGDDSATDIPDILHPAPEVRVLVANGTTVSGAAGRADDALEADKGYGGPEPTNTNAPAEATIIYYEPGYELDARQIAKILNAAPTAVAPMPEAPPGDELAEAQVLVVIGPDVDGLS